MIEIPSPTQTYDGRLLLPASEWNGSMLLLPVRSDLNVSASMNASLSAPSIEVVTLLRQRYRSFTAQAEFYLWSHDDNKPCPIENLCTECHGKGRRLEPNPVALDWFTCLECGGRGWHYAD